MTIDNDNVSGLRIKNDEHTVEVVAVIQSDRGPVAILDDGSMKFVGDIRDNYEVTDEPVVTAPADTPNTPASSDPTSPASPGNPDEVTTSPASPPSTGDNVS